MDHSPYRARPTRISDAEYDDVPAASLRGNAAPRPRLVHDETLKKRYEHYGEFAPVVTNRIKSRMLAAIIGWPFFNAAITWMGGVALGFETTPAQLPIAALYGFLLGYYRPSMTIMGLLTLGAPILMQLLAGTLVFSFGGSAGAVLYICAGMTVGWSEEMRISDGR